MLHNVTASNAKKQIFFPFVVVWICVFLGSGRDKGRTPTGGSVSLINFSPDKTTFQGSIGLAVFRATQKKSKLTQWIRFCILCHVHRTFCSIFSNFGFISSKRKLIFHKSINQGWRNKRKSKVFRTTETW